MVRNRRRTRANIPAVPGEVSCGWLTQALREAGHLGDAGEVSGLRLEALGGGQGLSGEVLRIHLSYSGDPGTAPASVVAKFPTTNAVNRGMMENLNIYEREVLFYRELSGEVPIPVPRYYGSAMDPGRSDPVTPRAKQLIDRLPPKRHVQMTRDVSKMFRPSKRRFALLLEDLGDSATVHDLAAPPDPAQVGRILSELAKVHAHFWGHPILGNHPMFDTAVSDMPLLQRNVFLERALAECRTEYDFVNESTEDIFVDAGRRYPDDVARINRPLTLGHGDTRSDNVLFFDDGSLRIVDWAMPIAIDPGYDVGYCLTACIEPADGREVARDLAQAYHRELTALGVDHPFDELWETIEATARATLVQQGLSLIFFQADYGEAGRPCDLWMPRALALLHP